MKLALAFVLATAASAQTAPTPPPAFHVVSITDHVRGPNDPPMAAHVKFIVGTVAGKRYTLEQQAMFFPYHFEVGKDYTVRKITDKSFSVWTVDKKGRRDHEDMNIESVEELAAQ